MTLTHLRLTLSAVVALCAVSASILALAVPTTQASYTTTIDPGDLIRGQSFSSVYYIGRDGFRYVFPNDKVYFTWYSDFDDVQVITDEQLAKSQIGGNVTYTPGVKMVKINTDPRTYAVDAGGVLRHVTTEAVATTLYGTNWNTKIDDIADGFFPNYTVGDPITSISDFSPSAVTANVVDINTDKGLMDFVVFYINESGNPSDTQDPGYNYGNTVITIQSGQSVDFFNQGFENHTATADDLSWGTGTLKPGESFIKKFEEPGTYTFFDSYDSSNTGTIRVE